MAYACKDCFSGHIHEIKWTGRTETVHGIPTYIADPPEGQQAKGIIVYICDAFGWELPNNRALSDAYARRTGCRVYTPDFNNGHWMSHDVMSVMQKVMAPGGSWLDTFMKGPYLVRAVSSFSAFLYFNRVAVCKPRIFDFFKALRAAEGSTLSVGVAGFCWGGLYTFLLASDSERSSDQRSLIDAGFTAHPSLLTIPKDAEAVKLPLSVMVGDIDIALNHSQAKQTKDILEGKDGSRYKVQIIPGAKHGFAIREDPKDEAQMKNAQNAEDEAVAWFKKWLLKE